MSVTDAVCIRKLTPEEWKICIEKGLCFCCQKAGHNSTNCSTFTSTPKPKVQYVNKEEELPHLQEINDDEDKGVARVTFSSGDQDF